MRPIERPLGKAGGNDGRKIPQRDELLLIELAAGPKVSTPLTVHDAIPEKKLSRPHQGVFELAEDN